MTNVINFTARKKSKASEQSIENYSQYLKLLNSPALTYEAKHLINQVRLYKVSPNTMAKAKAVVSELTERIESKELLTCQSLDSLQSQLASTAEIHESSSHGN